MLIRKVTALCTIVIFFGSCGRATLHQSANVTQSENNDNLPVRVVYDKMTAPRNVSVLNNKTGTEKYLTLQWTPVAGAQSYRIYYAVYPTYQYKSGSLAAKDYKLLVEIPARTGTLMTWNHNIPQIPLRRYSYRITSVNDREESALSSAADGWRIPIDEEEALKDIDYNIHFAQTSVPNFGRQGQDAVIHGRASGVYFYASKMSKIMSKFEDYADFETILNGNPSMKISLFPLGVRMKGDIDVSGLYKAVMTYDDLFCVVGGYARKGKIKIVYYHPSKGILQKDYTYDQIRNLLKTVAYDANEVKPRPPASEWDESDSEYIHTMRKMANLSSGIK